MEALNPSEDGQVPAPKKYPDELRERAVRMGLGPAGRSGDRARGALARVGQQLGINKDTLRNWVDREEIDIGLKPGVATAEQQRINELEREVRELRRANEILKTASAFFASMPN
jgi:transposase